ncbi:MAG: type VI secretion system amidase immunity protein Tai4 [Azoarcus sp.]|nr:type VI secretion system amidase immunity protein Tai4 [Azoarcus sp.]
MKHALAFAVLLALSACAALPTAKAPPGEGPRYRSNAQNYKDMILAKCAFAAYSPEERQEPAYDAHGASVIFHESTCYELTEDQDNESQDLIERYLMLEIPPSALVQKYKTIKTKLVTSPKLAKCIELYHSKALEDHIKKHVCEPDKVRALEERNR